MKIWTMKGRNKSFYCPYCKKMLKRIFDFAAAFLGLALLSPLLIIIAVAIKTDKGPVLFKQNRVGRRGRVFNIYKFRSMVPDAHKLGSLVTAEHDPRITRVGRFLRKTKLDELPQLFNVLKGDMSLVGPRPEVPYYVDQWSLEDQKTILAVKPGITDYATFLYNDEQAVLAQAEDPEEAYILEVMPHKLYLYRQYIFDQSLWLDLRILVSTLLKMIGINPSYLLPELKLCQERYNDSRTTD
jgi:lipopolysaccharide/colanic/teichoic acid biosynthesis glycosyltransferase